MMFNMLQSTVWILELKFNTVEITISLIRNSLTYLLPDMNASSFYLVYHDT